MRKAIIGIVIILMLSIIYIPTPVHAAAIPLPVVKAGATAIKQELKVIMGGAAVKAGVKVADKPALARAEEAWFTRLNTDQITSLETALQTSVPALEKPGFLRAAVPVALMLSGADLFIEISNLINQNQPLYRLTNAPQDIDEIRSIGPYSLELSEVSGDFSYYSIFNNGTKIYNRAKGIYTIYFKNTKFWLGVTYSGTVATLTVHWQDWMFDPYNKWGNVLDGSSVDVPKSSIVTASTYVQYYDTADKFSYTPLPYTTSPNPDTTKSDEVVYVYLPDPAVYPDADQAILDNKDTVLAPAAPTQTEPEPSPSPPPEPSTSPEPTTDPGTETGTDSNAGLFDWLKNAWADLMDWLHSFWSTFRNMLTDLFVPAAAIDTSPIKNIWTDKFPAISRITSALGGLTTLNYDQTPPVWKITLQGKQYVIIDLSTVPSGWMAMARTFMRIWIWSGLLFMILREWRPKPQIG